MEKTVLLVDDALFTRHMLKDVLVSNGYNVISEAGNGRNAVEKLNDLKPNLTIMDIVMPEMDGIDAVKDIKAKNPDADIIMCSGFGHQSMLIESIRC